MNADFSDTISKRFDLKADHLSTDDIAANAIQDSLGPNGRKGTVMKSKKMLAQTGETAKQGPGPKYSFRAVDGRWQVYEIATQCRICTPADESEAQSLAKLLNHLAHRIQKAESERNALAGALSQAVMQREEAKAALRASVSRAGQEAGVLKAA